MANLKLDSAIIEARDISQIHRVRPSKGKYKCFATHGEKVKNYNDLASLQNTSHGCGGKHFKSDCFFGKKKVSSVEE